MPGFLWVVFIFSKGGAKFAMIYLLTEIPNRSVIPHKESLWDFSIGLHCHDEPFNVREVFHTNLLT